MSPALLLTTWAAGVAAGGALVARWRIVGAGFLWLAGGISLVLGAIGALAGGGVAAWIGAAMAIPAVRAARSPGLALPLFAAASVAFAISAALEGDPLLVVTGLAALGGVTTEMLLGHWYLVDPRLPRWALKWLVVVAVGGLVLDGLVLAVGAGDGGASVATAVSIVMSIVSVVLMVAVWFALREPSYSAVMAATGLSYLALLTTLAATTIGRSLLGEGETILGVPRLWGL